MYGDGRVYWRGTKAEGSKDGGSYWLYFNRHGEEIRISARTNNKTRAKRMLRDELNKARTDAWVDPKDRKVTIGELVADLEKDYRTSDRITFADDVATRWRLHLQAKFEHMPALAFTTSAQREYRAARLKKGAAQATINRELQVIRRAYRLAADSEPPKVARVPKFLIVKEDNARKVFVSQEQYAALLSAASHEGLEWRVLLEMAYTLGWRRGELLSLRVKDFNLAEAAVRIETSKNGEPRECPVTNAVAIMLQQLTSGRAANALIFPQDIRYGWRRICKRAAVEGITFHDFRRTAAREKRSRGVSTSVIMEMQGWQSEAMFRRYAIVNLADKRAALPAEVAQKSHNSKGHDS